MVRLQSEPIDSAALVASVRGDGDGAVTFFLGTVRDSNRGRRVIHLEYEAYEAMAVRQMERIEELASEKFAVNGIAVVHRTGRLAIGEASVAIAVSAPHRGAAFDACRFIIDRIKQEVPIWKKECFEGGEVWIEGAGETPRRDHPKSSSSS